MRGLPNYNHDAFCEVEQALYAEGAGRENVFNPALSFGGDKDRAPSEYMQIDMQAVLDADVIVLLPGWENSEGADRETKLAEWTGKEFMLAEWDADAVRYRFRALDGLPSKTLSPRADALTEAQALITGDRNNAYGPPTQDFDRTAGMASEWGFRVNRSGKSCENCTPLKGHHVAIFMMMLKVSRLAWTPTKRDSWVDAAGYAGCGYECAVTEAEAEKAKRFPLQTAIERLGRMFSPSSTSNQNGSHDQAS